MELQELTVRAATIQLRFRLAPRFADIRGKLIEEIKQQQGLDDYGWGEAQLHLFNSDRTKTFIVGSRELRGSYEHLERIADYRAAAESFLHYGLEALNVAEVEFIGVRTYWLAAVDSFDELREAMIRTFSSAEPFSAAIGDRVTDAGWVFELHRQNPAHTVRLGPMRARQLLDQLFQTEKAELFPEQFFFMDFDRMYREVHVPADEAAESALASFDRALEIGDKVAAWLAAGGLAR